MQPNISETTPGSQGVNPSAPREFRIGSNEEWQKRRKERGVQASLPAAAAAAASIPPGASAASIAPLAVEKHKVLSADANEINRFFNVIFKRCVDAAGRPINGRIALRAFPNKRGNIPALVLGWEPFAGSPIKRATEAATQIARRVGDDAAVFAPPVCVFNNDGVAGEDDVLAGPVIIADLDADPTTGLEALKAILGTPTLVVASGGVWTGPDGSKHDKLHVYWRLNRPAMSRGDRALLKSVRLKIAEICGGDTSARSLSHPMRWPGSWHTKGEPRLCVIKECNDDIEIDLADAVSRIEGLAGTVDVATHREGRATTFKTKVAWSAAVLMEVAEALPNKDLDWDAWNKMGMTFFDAAHGSDDGLEALHHWSEKSHKYDPYETRGRWSHWHKHPPTDLSAGTLVREMRRIKPGWSPEDMIDEADIDPNLEPIDIFGDADPCELGNLPVGALPPMLTRLVQSEARRKGVAETFVAVSAVTSFGAAIGGDVRLQVLQENDEWTEGTNTWAVIVAPPGSAKSPIIKAMTRPHREINERWLDHDTRLHAEWYAASKRRGKDAPPPGVEPRIRRLVIDDVTSEKAIRIFRDNPRGVLQAPDELAGVLGGFGAYKSGGGADRAQFLRMFDGDSITSDRVGSGTTMAKRAQLTLLAGTQPEKLRTIVKELGADGLLQRFIVVLHDGREHPRIDEEPDRPATEWFSSAVTSLASVTGFPCDPVRLSPEAGRALSLAAERIRSLKHTPGASDALQGHLEKWGALLPRIVLIIHVARMLDPDPASSFDPAEMVSEDTVNMAVRFAQLLLRHSLLFYSTYFSPSAAATDGRWIAGYLLMKPELRSVRRRDIYDARKNLRGEENLRALFAAMRELETAAWCFVKEGDSSGPVEWEINPRIHKRFADRAAREKIDRATKHAKILEAGRARAWLSGGPETSNDGIFG